MATPRPQEEPNNAALLLIAWSRIWSPIVPEEVRAEAWEALELPGTYQQHKIEYWSTFHTGFPAPLAAAFLHVALGTDGANTREDWIRVMSYLELEWNNMHLPPDQLGIACEIYACLIDRQESFLIKELRNKYLIPWCNYAKAQLASQDPAVFSSIVEQFEQDVLSCG
jgi:hypothetical protein